MFMNPSTMYHTELTNIFLEALINDKESKYYQQSKLQIIEAMLNQYVRFRIDENETIFEKEHGNGKDEVEIFTKDHKNTDAIYAAKILLNEYPPINEEENNLGRSF